MAARLAAALETLGRKLGAQRDMILGATALAPRAEEVAIRARLLAFGCGAASPTAAMALAADIGGLAARASDLAARAEQAAEAGARAGGAIAGHAAALADLARDARVLTDGSLLRRALSPLVATLEALPGQRQEQGAIGEALARLAEQARPLATRAGQIASQGGEAAAEEALRLSRDLGTLATEAARLAVAIEQDTRGGDDVTEVMAGQIRGIAEIPAQSTEPQPRPRLPAQGLRPVPVLPQSAAAHGITTTHAMPGRRFGKAPVWPPG
jgi:hypothetical protein